jgi:hypothetical protein
MGPILPPKNTILTIRFGGFSMYWTSQECWIQRKEMNVMFLDKNQAYSQKWEYEIVSFEWKAH